VSSIDWSAELRKIEREFDGLPPEKQPAKPAQPRLKLEPTLKRLPGPRRAAIGERNRMLLSVWSRIVLVGALATGLMFWPYLSACGFSLYTYMFACLMTMVGGVWVTVHTWQNRQVYAHVLSLLLVLIGFLTMGAQIAPRVGYARAEAHWRCAK
jgi:hypothetical protein